MPASTADRPTPSEGRAPARAGLVGNPSDAYGGAAIAFAIADFEACVRIEAAARLEIRVAGGPALFAADDFDAAVAQLRTHGCAGPASLLRATLKRFGDHLDRRAGPRLPPERARLRLDARSDIPFQVGLAGSSALVIAALRALARWSDIVLDAPMLSELALAAEVEDLGIAAGPMDRVVQAFGGVVHMDFRGAGQPAGSSARYQRIDAGQLPPMLIAWEPGGASDSGSVHSDVRQRFARGEPRVREGLARIAGLVDAARDALARGDARALGRIAARNFEERAALFPISARDRERVAIANDHGAGAKLCGSGGAVLAVLEEPAQRTALEAAWRRAGHAVLAPRIAAAAADAPLPPLAGPGHRGATGATRR